MATITKEKTDVLDEGKSTRNEWEKKPFRIKFLISRFRKNAENKNYKPKLSPYWQRQFDQMFEGW